MRILSTARTIAALFFLLMVSNSSAKSIFIVDSYHASFPWTNSCREGLEANIDPAHTYTFYEMNTKRIPKSKYADKADQVWKAISEAKPDLVITMDDNALKLLGQRISDAGYPLIFMGVNHNPRMYFRNGKIPSNVSGILEHPLVKQNMAVIATLLPMKHKRILFMMDQGTTSDSIINNVLGGKRSVTYNGITLDIYQTNEYSMWQNQVNKLSSAPYDALITGSFANIRDRQSEQVPYSRISGWTSLNSPIPIFTVWAHAVGKDNAIGGLGIEGTKHGRAAAIAANTVLKTGSIANVDSLQYGQLIFSKSGLARWELTLPQKLTKRSVLVD